MNQLVKTGTNQDCLNVLGHRYDVDPNQVLAMCKAGIFRGFSDQEIFIALILAAKAELCPFNREIFLLKTKAGVAPYVSVDGFSTIMQRSGNVTGLQFKWGEEITHNGTKAPEWCEVHMLLKGWTEPVEIREWFVECYRPTEPWKTMPRRQLRHKAYRQAVRLTCKPGGVYLPDIDDVTELPAKFSVKDDGVSVAPGSGGLKERLAHVDSDSGAGAGGGVERDGNSVDPEVPGAKGDGGGKPQRKARSPKPKTKGSGKEPVLPRLGDKDGPLFYGLTPGEVVKDCDGVDICWSDEKSEWIRVPF